MKVLVIFCWAFLFSSFSGFTQFFDFPPQCVGGAAEFKRMVRQEMLYPEDELARKIGGKVLLSFIVNSDESIDSLKILESVSPAIDLEAKRLIALGQWSPAILDGRPISTYLLQKIIFKPATYIKWKEERGYVPSNLWPGEVFHFEQTNPPPKFYSGGSLNNFISRNLQYPNNAMNSGVEGKVLVRFVVEPSGRISNVGVDEALGGGCDEEAIRVVKKTFWKPGYFEGIPVRTQYYVPIMFSISDIKSSKSFLE